MSKKGSHYTRPVRRIDLSLPVARTDTHEVNYTLPPAQSRQPSTIRPVSRQKPVIDISSNLELNNPITTNQFPARRKHRSGPVLVSLFVDIPSIPTEISSTVVDSISNALISSGYSGQTLRSLPSITKYNKQSVLKDDGERSQVSSNGRLLFESVGSFEEPFMNRPRNGFWHNVHHPQLSSIKVLHARKPAFASNDSHTPAMNTSSMENFSQASLISTNDRLYQKVEKLTKNYFPSIQQLRHCHPCPELIHNRMHIHREEKRDFVPMLSRPRVGR